MLGSVLNILYIYRVKREAAAIFFSVYAAVVAAVVSNLTETSTPTSWIDGGSVNGGMSSVIQPGVDCGVGGEFSDGCMVYYSE